MQDKFWGGRTWCLVTGASQGIGRSLAVAFAQQCAPGSRLVLLARSVDGLQQTQALVTAANPQVTAQIHSVDLSQPSAEGFRDLLQDEEGGGGEYELHMLVHNAGSVGRADQRAADMDNPEEWHRYMSLNLYHVTCLTAEFLRRFPTGRRCVLNITSLCALQPFKSMGYYCVGKAAREMYFRVLAQENTQVNVLSYSPGPVDTDMISEVIQTIGDKETKQMFVTMKDSRQLVTLEQTTQKLVAVLASQRYNSGDRFDYFDPILE